MKASGIDPAVSGPTRLLDSVLEQIPLVVAFKGKWAMVKSKLGDLQTLLVDSTDFPASASNSMFLDLIRSVTHTLDDALSLAAKCQSANLSQGKLRTQSDIDSILARLDRHVKDGEILIRSGSLQEGAVPSGSSKRDAVRAESRNLITRLQIGCAESRNSAMDSLLRLLGEDDKNVMIAGAQGIVPVLVRMLDSSSLEMKEKTVAVISRVSTVESCRNALIAEGLMLLNHLIRVLESGSGLAKEKACIALEALSRSSKENARAIGSRGGISSLLEICQGGTPGAQGFAAGVLRNLAGVEETKVNFMEENAVFVLIGLAASGTPSAQENAIGCLSNLVKGDDELKIVVVREGGMECLRNYWESSPPVRSLEPAVDLLRHLGSNEAIGEVLVSNGFVSRVISVLNCGVLRVRIAAAKAVYELGFSSKSRKEMGESGCVRCLIRMLADGKAIEEKEAAAKALSRLVLCAENRRIFTKDERGIVSSVQLLDPSVENLDKRYPIAILSLLVHSSKCRKQMIAAGVSVHLRMLIGMEEVEGAKKLLEGLGKGKIWGVFSRP